MPRRTLDVTDAELRLLDQLWREAPLTIRELTDRVYPGGGTSAYATVQKLLERLEGKRCVGREAGGRSHRFRARVAREDLIAASLRDTADRLCAGSMTPLLTTLVKARRLSRDELAAMRDLVDRLDRRRKGR